ncbi:MAG: trehalose-6-phosphate synthase [Sporichthyaceae bacterium]|nr:trehalose-6-phosphate synthase [Sporichthyaceae bacterium]
MSGSRSASILLASNRGPVSFWLHDDGSLVSRRGGGGLVSGLSGVAEKGVVWVCAALSEADRMSAKRAPDGRLGRAGFDTAGADVHMLDIDLGTYHRAYNAIANSTLWFLHHLLYDIAKSPSFDRGFRREWASYQSYNLAFAQALADDAAEGARVLIQDYHLALAPAMLRQLRPDLRIGHFSHTPWAPVEYFMLLPDDVAAELLSGILGADHAGFLTRRWADAFAACCAELFGASVESDRVSTESHSTRLGVHPLGADPVFLTERAAAPDVLTRRAGLRELVGNRALILRVDRTELSKNIVRGLQAYRELLRVHPEWHGRVVHLVFAYPSRHDIPEYREYTAAVQRIATEIEDEFGTADWQPIVLEVEDDFARSLAAYRLADVIVVNPVRDGMNLVAKEVPVVSERGCALVLSREAGAHDELGEWAIVVNPFDIIDTADGIYRALTMDPAERSRRSQALAQAATALPPQRWFAAQLDALAAVDTPA